MATTARPRSIWAVREMGSPGLTRSSWPRRSSRRTRGPQAGQAVGWAWKRRAGAGAGGRGDAGAAGRAGVGLGVEAAVVGVVVLPLAVGTHLEAGHRGRCPV